MNISSKKPKPFCMVVGCPRKSVVTIKFQESGALVRFCSKHAKEAVEPVKAKA